MTDVEIRQQRGLVQALPLAIKHWRVDHKGWSQETAAKKASATAVAKAEGVRVSPSTFAMIETGKRQPSLAVAQAIAEAFEIPVGAFALVSEGVLAQAS